MSDWKSTLATLGAAVIGFFGGYWTFASTVQEQVAINREIDVKMIDVALAILAGEKGVDGSEQSLEARRFAVRILRQYSAIENDREGDKPIGWDDWAEDLETPFKFDRDLIFYSSPRTDTEAMQLTGWGPMLRKTFAEETEGTIPSAPQRPKLPDDAISPDARATTEQIDELERQLQELSCSSSEFSGHQERFHNGGSGSVSV